MAPTPVLLPGKSHGWRSLVGCSPWGCKELDMIERLSLLLSAGVDRLHRYIHVVPSLSDSVRRRQWHPIPVLLPGKSHG